MRWLLCFVWTCVACNSRALVIAEPPRDAGADLATGIDLAAAPPDLATPVDFSIPIDLAVPRDLTPPFDFTAPRDLTPPPDLTHPPVTTLAFSSSDSAYGTPWRSIVVLDFDHDGFADVAVGGAVAGGGGELLLLQNSGSLGLTSADTVPLTAAPVALAAGDLDRDGWPDIVAADAAYTVFWGGSAWASRYVRSTPYAGGTTTGLGVGDLDDDGYLDVAASNSTLGAMQVWRGSWWGLTSAFRVPQSLAQPGALAVGVFASGPPRLGVAYGGVLPGSTAPLVHLSIGVLSGYSFNAALNATADAVATGDVDGDGLDDIVTANTAASSVAVIRYVAGPPPLVASPAVSMANPSGVLLADFNADGKLDLVTADAPDLQLQLALGNGDGTFQPPTAMTLEHPPFAIAAADFDLDGLIDLVAGDSDGYVTTILNRSY
ncbi:MAG TPA: VCBS repeat-containing protein [Polyangia bacterium]|nr:VCBS repeat-containing protein [Polyangia bacterium]